MTNWPKIHLLEGRLRWWRVKNNFRARKLAEHRGTLQRSYHWLKINEQKRNLKAVATDKREIAKERPLVKKWEGLAAEAQTEMQRLAAAIHQLRPRPPAAPGGEGYSVPNTVWNPYRRKIANWIVRELYDAVKHGANGIVTSGVRTYSEQARLYWIYQHGGNIAARPGSSNHEGYVLPRGAVDWSNPESLWAALRRKPNGHKLTWAESVGLRDTVHFSRYGR